MLETLSQPWPWYVAGPLVGLIVPILLLIGNKTFGISSSFRHVCASTVPGNSEFLRYDWKRETWNLIFVAGIVLGAFLASRFIPNPDTVAISAGMDADLTALGVTDRGGLLPASLFSWGALGTLPGIMMMVVGGFLVGFGSRYAGGCTSGHAIMGLASLQWVSLLAVCGFFVGGLIMSWGLLPLILGGGH